MTLRRDYLQAIQRVFIEHGIQAVWKTGGKHLKAEFEWNGKPMTYVCSATPSDRRSVDNAVAELRRMLGVKRKIVKNPERREKNKAASAPKKMPEVTVRPNPWDALKQLREDMCDVALPEFPVMVKVDEPWWRRAVEGLWRKLCAR